MKTVICNSLQSFWDMADNELLEGLNVHCVFHVNDQLKSYILGTRDRYKINQISFSKVIRQHALTM
ncbi:hypothetical protein [Vibrio porteresiae]|uniref:Exonuclease V subunit gamma n=1 Tax=Vibrio porteresiae DSM 19223 TaxID=1123496 RepID=A0ABZ0QE21_9VIBR|nr:hypothetical protein [Vibrio porteresiae]WPC74699.1 hypothetical protein R8Z52_05630 [Vibrio porteresiae DSM 19223]